MIAAVADWAWSDVGIVALGMFVVYVTCAVIKHVWPLRPSLEAHADDWTSEGRGPLR